MLERAPVGDLGDQPTRGRAPQPVQRIQHLALAYGQLGVGAGANAILIEGAESHHHAENPAYCADPAVPIQAVSNGPPPPPGGGRAGGLSPVGIIPYHTGSALGGIDSAEGAAPNEPDRIDEAVV